MNKDFEEEYESPYCEVCGTCGYIGCCGIRNFIEEHIKGKTNCKNEDLIISELIDMCEYEDRLQQRIDKAIEYMEHYIKVEELNEPVKVEFKEVMGMLRGEENDN